MCFLGFIMCTVVIEPSPGFIYALVKIMKLSLPYNERLTCFFLQSHVLISILIHELYFGCYKILIKIGFDILTGESVYNERNVMVIAAHDYYVRTSPKHVHFNSHLSKTSLLSRLSTILCSPSSE